MSKVFGSIGIIGLGVVGGALYRHLKKDRPDLTIYRRDPGLGLFDPVEKADLVFICVPAPTKGFKVDLAMVEDALEWSKSSGIVIVRTTIPPGASEYLSKKFEKPVMFMPEFLTERCADEGMESMDVALGIPAFNTIEDKEDVKNALHVFRVMVEHLLKKNVYLMSADEAAIAKYAHNVMGALKVTFFNGIYDLCEQMECSYENVLKAVLLSGHINPDHTQVPGPDGERGFGGKCFPKDLEAFIGVVGSYPLHLMLKDVLCLNRHYREDKKINFEELKHT